MKVGYRIAAAAAVIVLIGITAIGLHRAEPQPAAFGRVPLHFEPAQVAGAYVARGAGYLLELSTQASTLHLARADGGTSLKLQLIDAQAAPAQAEGALPGVSNYFIGKDPARWRTSVPHFQRVRYTDVYPGIDLVYYGAGRELEYDFIVAPGASPAAIRFGYEGALSLRIDSAGNLRVGVEGGEVVHRKPVVYQQLANGARAMISGAFRVARSVVSFEIGKYDTRLPLVIDPVLTYATYLGGTADNEEVTSIAVDGAGAVYVTGQTLSTNFPVTGGAADVSFNGQFDVFVAKLNPQGTALEYATYLGGSSFDHPDVVRIDAAGNAYIAGATTSTNFPV
ncbi:MAG TPA: SBBP repeat-containing protein, partial [Steroidobacteraceae bacterium]|nr:SBBP repeat-containing protein [Steroidobacteraceae bacterium]